MLSETDIDNGTKHMDWRTFAKIETKTALAMVLREWELRPVTGEFKRAIAITA